MTTERRTRIVTSASQAGSGMLGASRVWEPGHLGLSADSYRNDYGIVADDDITIAMRRDKLALAGELRSPAGSSARCARKQRPPIASMRRSRATVPSARRSRTAAATLGSRPSTALNLWTSRVEGSLGMQFDSSHFSAPGEEAFLPTTHTRQAAACVLERWSWGALGHLSAGVRGEQVRVRSDGDTDSGMVQFGPAQERSLLPGSASTVGTVRPLAPLPGRALTLGLRLAF